MSLVKSFVGFIGRAFFSLLFLAGGLQTALHWQEGEQLLTLKLHNWMILYLEYPEIQDGLAWGLEHASNLLLAAVVLQLLGGVMLFLGAWVRIGALLLLLYLVPMTFLDHYFWLSHVSDQTAQVQPFLQQLALIGALLLFLAFGKGRRGYGHHTPPKIQLDSDGS